MDSTPCAAETKMRRFYFKCRSCERTRIFYCSFLQIQNVNCERCGQPSSVTVVSSSFEPSFLMKFFYSFEGQILNLFVILGFGSVTG